jgi:hypothetical protein
MRRNARVFVDLAAPGIAVMLLGLIVGGCAPSAARTWAQTAPAIEPLPTESRPERPVIYATAPVKVATVETTGPAAN